MMRFERIVNNGGSIVMILATIDHRLTVISLMSATTGNKGAERAPRTHSNQLSVVAVRHC